MSEATKVIIDGVIKEARIEPWFDGKSVALGKLYGDRKKRFNDGTPIHTSYIVSGPDESGIIHTLNGIYQLEMRGAPPVVKVIDTPPEITVEDGKYTLVMDPLNMRALRYGNPWRDLCGDGLVMALGHEIIDLKDALENLVIAIGMGWDLEGVVAVAKAKVGTAK